MISKNTNLEVSGKTVKVHYNTQVDTITVCSKHSYYQDNFCWKVDCTGLI